MQGKQLLSGCDEEDYMVMVGDKMCVITEMTASKITCQPPNKTPQMSMEADIYHELPQCVVGTMEPLLNDHHSQGSWIPGLGATNAILG